MTKTLLSLRMFLVLMLASLLKTRLIAASAKKTTKMRAARAGKTSYNVLHVQLSSRRQRQDVKKMSLENRTLR